MQEVQFNESGEPSEVLNIVEKEIPSPGPGEVLIRVRACPINPSDTMFVRGLYGLKPSFPNAHAGFEGAGEIEALGEGVALSKGAKVMFTNRGTWTQYICVSEKAVIPVPESWSFEIACQSFVNPFTAWAMLHESGLKAGDFLLLTAGGSTFSQLVIQMAKAKGIHCLATLRRDDQIEQLEKLGVHTCINTEKEDLISSVYKITAKKGADACFEAVGGDIASQALKSLKAGGEMFVYGLLSLKNPVMDSGLMIFKSLKIRGFWLSEWMPNAASEVKKQMRQEVFSQLGSDLKVEIEGKYSLQDIKEAVKHAEAPGRKGKVLLIP